MKQMGVAFLGRRCEVAHPCCIDRKRVRLIAFRLVHCRIGGGVQHQIRLIPVHHRAQRDRVRDVQFTSVQSNAQHVWGLPKQLAAELALRADGDRFHCKA
jgi:hypothetical protein